MYITNGYFSWEAKQRGFILDYGGGLWLSELFFCLGNVFFLPQSLLIQDDCLKIVKEIDRLERLTLQSRFEKWSVHRKMDKMPVGRRSLVGGLWLLASCGIMCCLPSLWWTRMQNVLWHIEIFWSYFITCNTYCLVLFGRVWSSLCRA